MAQPTNRRQATPAEAIDETVSGFQGHCREMASGHRWGQITASIDFRDGSPTTARILPDLSNAYDTAPRQPASLEERDAALTEAIAVAERFRLVCLGKASDRGYGRVTLEVTFQDGVAKGGRILNEEVHRIQPARRPTTE